MHPLPGIIDIVTIAICAIATTPSPAPVFPLSSWLVCHAIRSIHFDPTPAHVSRQTRINADTRLIRTLSQVASLIQEGLPYLVSLRDWFLSRRYALFFVNTLLSSLICRCSFFHLPVRDIWVKVVVLYIVFCHNLVCMV